MPPSVCGRAMPAASVESTPVKQKGRKLRGRNKPDIPESESFLNALYVFLTPYSRLYSRLYHAFITPLSRLHHVFFNAFIHIL